MDINLKIINGKNKISYNLYMDYITFDIEHGNIIFYVMIQNIDNKLRFMSRTNNIKSSMLIINENNINHGIRTLLNIPNYNNNFFILSCIPKICTNILKQLNNNKEPYANIRLKEFINKILSAYNKLLSLFQFKSKKDTILRFQANNADPNMNHTLNDFQFKGQKILTTDKLKYPNGNIYNNFVLVQDLKNPNIIGYILKDNLVSSRIINNQPTFISPITTKLLNNVDGTNVDELNESIKPIFVNPTNNLIYPAGQKITFKDESTDPPSFIDYIIVQKIDNPNVFGYIKFEDLELSKIVEESNNMKSKYLKYKMKYLKLKQESRI
jgi:hypothetical protein